MIGRPRKEWNQEAARCRFLTHVDKNGPNGCWLWTGAKDGKYGAVNYKGKKMAAHRAAYLLFVGPIPDGIDARHKCDNPPCVNWESHIIPGSRRENIADMIERGRRHDTAGEGSGRTHLTENQVIRILLTEPTPGYRKRLAEEFGISLLNVCQIRTGYTWAHLRPDIPRARLKQVRVGHDNPWAKLTDEMIADIFTAPRRRGTNKFLAHKHGVSKDTVVKIRNGSRWSEVTKNLERKT